MRSGKGCPVPISKPLTAVWPTPHMLDQFMAAMEAEEGAIESFREFKPFGG